jgi:TonB family protein
VAAPSSPTEISAATEPSAAELLEPSATELAADAPVFAGASAAGAGADTGVVKGVGSGASGTASTTPGSAVRGAPGIDVAALRARYLGQLRERVLARREYPRLARRAGLEGTVCLRIAVDAAGRLAQLQPSCVAPAPLVEAALSAVRAAAPFGPLPGGLGTELVLDLPMVFQLDAG